MRNLRWALLAVPLVPAILYGAPRARAALMASASIAPPKLGSYSTAEEASAGADLTGKVAVVTGASSGIGTETARVLALRGANVVLAVRNAEAGEKARAAIIKELEGKVKAEGGADVASRLTVLNLDLQSLASVRSFAESFAALNLPLHLLINNAGVMMCPYMVTKDGVENQFGTNHLGHFHLTNLLLPKLKETASKDGAEGRIVILSSMAHLRPYMPEGIRFDRLTSPEGYATMSAYGQSKLANVLHARELARRLKEEGANVTVNALHPGVIRTELSRHIEPNNAILRSMLIGTYHVLLRWFMKTIPQGAATSCYVATSPAVAGVSGHYFSDCHEAEKEASALSKDMELAKKLWETSEKMVKDIEEKGSVAASTGDDTAPAS